MIDGLLCCIFLPVKGDFEMVFDPDIKPLKNITAVFTGRCAGCITITNFPAYKIGQDENK